MRAAAPGTVVVGESTARRLGERFTLEPRAALLSMAGRSERVAVSRLVGVREARPRRPRALVGREAEVVRLRAIADDLGAGRGQALLLVGEAGAGKTRMLAELRSAVPEQVTWLEGNCLSYGGLASWPFVEMLRRWLDLEVGDAEVVVRTRARARLTPLLGDDPGGALAGLARLLGIESGAEDAGQAYVAWVEALTAESPVVLAIEDLHWAHATTRRLADDLLALTDRVPLLLAGTLRRDVDTEGWRFRTRVLTDFSHRATELRLDPLPREPMDEILANLLPGALDDATGREIVARAEGNPLYMEELLRALLEGGGLDRRHRTWTTSLRPAALLPPALENLLVARIDRLSESARRLAQVAAIIGREFQLRLLERVAGEGAGDDLAELLRAEIVREARRYPEPVYAFRHGLLQEATLSSLTHERRRELYGAVAAALEAAETASLDDYVEQLAHYHAQSGNTAQAIAYLERAAARADELGTGSRADDLRARAVELAAGRGSAT